MGYFIQKITPVVLSVLIAASVFMFCMLTRGGTEDKKGGKLIEGSAPLGKYEETINITVGQMISASNYVNGENEKKNQTSNQKWRRFDFDFLMKKAFEANPK